MTNGNRVKKYLGLYAQSAAAVSNFLFTTTSGSNKIVSTELESRKRMNAPLLECKKKKSPEKKNQIFEKTTAKYK